MGSNLASTALGDPIASLCLSLGACEAFTLVVNLPATFYTTNPNAGVQIGINWASVAIFGEGSALYLAGWLSHNAHLAETGRLGSGSRH